MRWVNCEAHATRQECYTLNRVQTGSENSLYPNILSSLKMRLPSSHDGSDGFTWWGLGKKLDTWWKAEQKQRVQRRWSNCLFTWRRICSLFSSLSYPHFHLFTTSATVIWYWCFPKCSNILQKVQLDNPCILFSLWQCKKCETKMCVSVRDKNVCVCVWQNIKIEVWK